jgi:hypothetical protein
MLTHCCFPVHHRKVCDCDLARLGVDDPVHHSLPVHGMSGAADARPHLAHPLVVVDAYCILGFDYIINTNLAMNQTLSDGTAWSLSRRRASLPSCWGNLERYLSLSHSCWIQQALAQTSRLVWPAPKISSTAPRGGGSSLWRDINRNSIEGHPVKLDSWFGRAECSWAARFFLRSMMSLLQVDVGSWG